MNYVPELEEERFQSMVAVPVPARSGEVLGVVVLHTVAPREFGEGVLNFLVHTALLVAGAIENARLYEESRRGSTRSPTSRAQRADRRGHRARTALSGGHRGVRRLLGCDACQLCCATATTAARARGRDPAESFPGRASSPARCCATIAASSGPRHVRSGVRTFPAQHEELLQAVANQAALALRNAEHIERLTAENLVRSLFEALDDGALDFAEARARAAGATSTARTCYPRPAPQRRRRPPWSAVAERLEARLRTLEAGALVDPGRDALRGLLPLPQGAGGEATLPRCAARASEARSG